MKRLFDAPFTCLPEVWSHSCVVCIHSQGA